LVIRHWSLACFVESVLMSIDLKRLSKTIAHALRHEPWVYELELDEDGWVPVDDLLAGLQQQRRWRHLAESDLQRVLALPGKRRYEMVDGRIRALYGHSTTAKIRKRPAVPPVILYHGTAPETADLILREGLKPMRRQYVHLSVDEETAWQVGRRKAASPVILVVMAGQAYRNGVIFYEGHDLVWLADFVPAPFVKIKSER
jgi:putative RNA 2'-phosphotransferase